MFKWKHDFSIFCRHVSPLERNPDVIYTEGSASFWETATLRRSLKTNRAAPIIDTQID